MALTNGPNLGVLVDGAIGEVHYDALMQQWRAMDALVQPRVKSAVITTPPISPADGDCYIIPAGATGVWSSNVGKIARYSIKQSAWEYYTPKNGWVVQVESSLPGFLKFNGTTWVDPLTTKADLVGGKVPSDQLPSYVDDVLEYANIVAFPVTGETGKIYVAIDTGNSYRWSGSVYTKISQPLDEIPQTEAEAGTASILRAITARRLFQASAAWWLTASSALGRTLASIADAAAGRTALGLGSASVLAAGQADPNVPTNSDVRAYYGVRYKPAVAPTLVIDFESSYFAIYNASTNSLFVADNWDAFTTYLGADLTISRAGEQTYFDAIGVMRTAAANTIQCDHDPLTGRRLGPYIGSARTNILLASEVPATQSVNVTAQAYTLSFYGTGTITLSGAHTATLVGSGAFPVRSTLTFTPAAGILTLTVSEEVLKFQLEAGIDASPYIPTTTSSVTRPATTVSIGGTKFTGCYNQTQGTFVLQYNRPVRAALSSVALSVGDGTTQNRMYFLTGNSSATAFDYFETTTAGVGQGSTGNVATTVGRAAFSYTTNSVVVGKNGVSYTDVTFAVPAVNKLDLGHRDAASHINGHLTSVTYYPVALSTNPVVELAK